MHPSRRGDVPPLDPHLQRRLGVLADAMRRHVLVEGVAIVLVFLAVAFAVQLGIDYAARLSLSMRAALLLVILVPTAYLLWTRVIKPLRSRVGIADAAKIVERKHPQLSSGLISAVQFSAGDIGAESTNSRELAAAVVQQAAHSAAEFSPRSMLNTRRARRAQAGIAAVVGVVVLFGLLAPNVAGLWFARNVLLRDVDWWQRTRLFVEADGSMIHAARGDDLEIRARAEGTIPRQVEINFETDSGKRGKETMVLVGGSNLRHTFRAVQEEFTFYIRGGDARTDAFQVVLAERPRIDASEITITPPEYSGLPQVALKDGQRSAEVLLGSTVRIWVETNKPITVATLMSNDAPVSEAQPERMGWSVQFEPMQTSTYYFHLIDENGLENRNPVRFAVRVTKDEAPSARLAIVGAGEMITPEAVVPIEVEFADQYGLSTVALGVAIEGETPRDKSVALPGFESRSTRFKTTVEWDVASVAGQPGERCKFVATATDFDNISGPNEGKSQERTLQIVTREEMLSELVRREHELRLDFERVVQSQERLRGDLLSVVRDMLGGASQSSVSAALAPLERRQRSIAGSLNVLRQQFEQIASERRINRLDTSAEMERLVDRIIAPITQLARRDALAAADRLRQLAHDLSRETADTVDADQAALISAMQAILASMVEMEGYQEILSVLRDIIELEKALGDEVRQSQIEQADELFDD